MIKIKDEQGERKIHPWSFDTRACILWALMFYLVTLGHPSSNLVNKIPYTWWTWWLKRLQGSKLECWTISFFFIMMTNSSPMSYSEHILMFFPTPYYSLRTMDSWESTLEAWTTVRLPSIEDHSLGVPTGFDVQSYTLFWFSVFLL